MWNDNRSSVLVVWVHAALVVAVGLALRSANGSELATTTSAPTGEDRKALQTQLAASAKVLADRGPALEQRLERVGAELKDLEARQGSLSAAELTERKDKLAGERTSLQKELRHLASAKTAWQAALDACESAERFRQELEQFRTDQERKKTEFVAGDVGAFQSQLAQIQSARASLDEGDGVRNQRLAALAEQIEKADDQTRPLLQAERAALQAEAAATRHKRAALDAERALLEVKLTAVGRVLGRSVATRPTTTSTAPAPEHEKAEALNKQRLAEQLRAEARNRLGHAQERLKAIQTRLTRAPETAPDKTKLENDREYWKRAVAYEERRLEQAELHKVAAQETQAIGQLRERVQSTGKNLDQLPKARRQMSQDQRRQQADSFKTEADAARARAEDLEPRAKAERNKIQPIQQRLLSFDAVEKALWERLQQASLADYQQLSDHLRRMKRQLDTERQQIDLMIMTMDNIVFAITRQATLERQLAGLYTQCADVLVPPVPSFWERNVKIINSVKMAGLVVVISYGIKLIVWLIRLAVGTISLAMPVGRGRFSVKRIGTLVNFAGSIVKLFVWIFGAIAVLNEFGINPAKSGGAIGLIGLIMAGMFREIVVDFVKGLDIIAGGHYNVGDFIEVDGKQGHVIDFNVKHTRIRTLSGQEFSIPNSRCVPSRRFPDGYVNNYVDIPVKSPADEQRAKAVIDPLCTDLNHRIEPMRDTPALAVCFDGPKGRVVMRYRVRVLPGCDWVVTDFFLPAVKQALADAGIELAGEPTFFFINRLKTFRKLFSRELNEEEIVRELDEEEKVRQVRQVRLGPTTDEAAVRAAASGSSAPSRPDEHA